MLNFLAEMRYFLCLVCAFLGLGAIVSISPLTIDESKLQSLTGRVVTEISGDGLTLDVKPPGKSEPVRVNVQSRRIPQKIRPDMISETVTVRFEKPDNVLAMTVNGKDYMTIAETLERDRINRESDRKFVSIALPIVLSLLIASFWARRRQSSNS
jgi:hypothetical protein